MTNSNILNIALTQSAIDLNCNPKDLMSMENKVVISQTHPRCPFIVVRGVILNLQGMR